jgi:2-alkenal reductase
MVENPRSVFRLFIAILALSALACGSFSLGGSDEATTESATAALDSDAIIAAAVATVEAQSQGVSDRPVTTTGEVIDLELQNTLIDLYDRISPAVVFILASESSGTGFVLDTEGHIVTNNHVLVDETEFEVVFYDGARRSARVTGRDVDSDLAVIQVDDLPEGITPVTLGDSNNVDVGQFVIAIGNPFAQQSSMSFGIVSGLGRSLESQRSTGSLARFSLPEVIQTDAPINPGNSGGPLLNLAGEVIGVNSAIRTTTGVNSGVGFSIPVNAVKRIAPALISEGSYTYPYLGVQIGSLNLTQQERLGLDSTEGALVTLVPPGEPAATAGIEAGDVILEMDGTTIKDSDALISYLVFNTVVGQTVDVLVVREGGELIIPVTLGERP